MRTACPTHGPDCPGVDCPDWRRQRAKDAQELSEILEKAHRARVANDFMRLFTSLSGPVPAVRDREEDPTLMIWAYALLVERLVQAEAIARQDAPDV